MYKQLFKIEYKKNELRNLFGGISKNMGVCAGSFSDLGDVWRKNFEFR